MNRDQGHLDIEALGDLLAGLPSPGPQKLLPQAIQQHLSECEACRKLLEMYENSGRDLQSLQVVETLVASSQCPASPQCPDEQILRELAAGVENSGQTDEILEHITSCTRCGPLYRRISEEMSSDLSAEEEQILAGLRLSKPSAQAALAHSLEDAHLRASEDRPVPRNANRLRTSLSAALAATLVLCAVIVWIRHGQQHANPDADLAAAYAEQRPFDFRFAGVPYAPLRTERGAGSAAPKAPSLLQAELGIKQALSASPDDPVLLDAKGKAELFEAQFDAAIADSASALSRRPGSSVFLSDLAIAYALRGDEQNQTSDYTKADDLLGRALQIDPSNRIALFNKALVDERLGLIEAARKDWEQYLASDPAGDWAKEARDHLDQIRR